MSLFCKSRNQEILPEGISGVAVSANLESLRLQFLCFQEFNKTQTVKLQCLGISSTLLQKSRMATFIHSLNYFVPLLESLIWFLPFPFCPSLVPRPCRRNGLATSASSNCIRMQRHGNCIPPSSSEVHVIRLIFPPAENSPFLLVEATVCCRFCDGRQVARPISLHGLGMRLLWPLRRPYPTIKLSDAVLLAKSAAR